MVSDGWTYAVLSSIADNVERRTLVHLKNGFVEVNIEVGRAAADAAGRGGRRRG